MKLTFLLVLTSCTISFSQGSLFIIGGGDRPPAMMQRMIQEAQLTKTDHIAILTMSSATPDTSYYYIKEDLRPVTSNQIAKLQFSKSLVNDKSMLDSVKHAKLIFITGGVQTRFMNVVLNTPVFDAIHYAYNHGAMIAGTSAGAAVMSEIMITGDQIRADTLYSGSVDRIVAGNMETKQGLGFLKNTIVDQHFIKRSRYNRLLTLLAQYPDKICIGIDEATAVLVRNRKAEVIGNSQIILLQNKSKKMKIGTPLRLENIKMSVLTDGDQFKLRL
ncbi:MAG: cyanophycinase [Saprospiraceae bacterium]